MEDGAGRPGAGLDAYAARLREAQEAVLSEESRTSWKRRGCCRAPWTAMIQTG